MPSPFPGMDPYLEVQPFWSDLHAALNTAMKAELKKRLPARYAVWSDVYIWLHEPDAEMRIKKKPDVLVTHPSTEPGSPRGLATLAAPATTLLPAVRREGNRYLKIKEIPSGQVVTVVELLSPANKTPGE